MEGHFVFKIIFYGRDFEQDIRPLVQSFLPQEELQVYCFDTLPASSLKQEPELEKGWQGVLLFLEEERFAIVSSVSKESGKIFTDELTKEEQKLSKKEKHRQYRNRLLRLLYQIFEEGTNRSLPWGILTGVRPVKLILDLIEQKKKEQDIKELMTRQYFISKDRLDLGLEVAKREKKLLDSLDYKNGYSLYIGIPFCPSICHYCSFSSFPLQQYKAYVEPYLAALEKEIRYASTCFLDQPLHTIYFGGGTPTTLEAEQLERLLLLLKKHFDLSELKELTVEAGRPDSITKEKLAVLKEQGVTRISINPQTMQDRTLSLIGRKHQASEVEEAFFMAREAGHDNINMDLILGLTGESLLDVEHSLSRIKYLQPESLTIHTLSIKRAARLRTDKKQYEGMEATQVETMMKRTKEFAKEEGYFPYYLYRQKNMKENMENIGYSKEGKENLYNILIMEEKQRILALGAGASSKFVFHGENRFERVENVKNISDYIHRIDEMIDRKKSFLAALTTKGGLT